MNRHITRSLADCKSKEDTAAFLEMVAIHTKDTVLAGLARTWKHLHSNVSVDHKIRAHGPILATRLDMRERQVVGRINERLAQTHPSVGTI
jgi:ribose 1,5-bisphosphokinase PhnN